MCTVSYLPAATGFVLTHNRDEAPLRSPNQLIVEPVAGASLLFPKDTLAGGTWIAASDTGRAACLLNGAFLRHTRHLPYRRSRGLVLLDSFAYKQPLDFATSYHFDQIEPFTFLSFTATQLLELRWDGRERHINLLDTRQAHFWCSATLYTPEIQVLRQQVFLDWLAQTPQPASPEAVLHLHRTGSIGDPEQDFVMNRAGRAQTVSITQLVLNNNHWQMDYFDLPGGASDRQSMFWQKMAATGLH